MSHDDDHHHSDPSKFQGKWRQTVLKYQECVRTASPEDDVNRKCHAPFREAYRLHGGRLGDKVPKLQWGGVPGAYSKVLPDDFERKEKWI